MWRAIQGTKLRLFSLSAAILCTILALLSTNGFISFISSSTPFITIGVISWAAYLFLSETSLNAQHKISQQIAAAINKLNPSVNNAEVQKNADVLEAIESLNQYLQTNNSDVVGRMELIIPCTEEMESALAKIQGMSDQQKIEIGAVESSLEQLTHKSESIASKTIESSEAAIHAMSSLTSGSEIVQGTHSSIGTLTSRMHDAVEVLQQFEQNSNEIGGVLDVIKGIAEQTNLLALNAAIEAARAGEMGRGFAVVADEVRTLAKRTQDSTSQIESMITNLQQSALDASNVINESQTLTEKTAELIEKSNQSLTSIFSSVEKINMLSQEIARDCTEQSDVTRESSKNVIAIRQASEESSTYAGDVTDAISMITEQQIDLLALFKA